MAKNLPPPGHGLRGESYQRAENIRKKSLALKELVEKEVFRDWIRPEYLRENLRREKVPLPPKAKKRKKKLPRGSSLAIKEFNKLREKGLLEERQMNLRKRHGLVYRLKVAPLLNFRSRIQHEYIRIPWGRGKADVGLRKKFYLLRDVLEEFFQHTDTRTLVMTPNLPAEECIYSFLIEMCFYGLKENVYGKIFMGAGKALRLLRKLNSSKTDKRAASKLLALKLGVLIAFLSNHDIASMFLMVGGKFDKQLGLVRDYGIDELHDEIEKTSSSIPFRLW